MDLSTEERLAMLIITGITNISCFPGVYMIYQKKMYFHFHMGIFTFFTSFMYHSLNSLKVKRFYLTSGQWHELDNIGAIMCFIMLLVYWMDNVPSKPDEKSIPVIDIHLNMIGLFITLIMQKRHPWDLVNTIVPIMVFAILLICKQLFYRRSRFNTYYLYRGGIFMAIGVFCFYKGLDEFSDYLGIWHGFWHCNTGIAFFYLYQSIDKDKEQKGVILPLQRQKRYHLSEVLRSILKLKAS